MNNPNQMPDHFKYYAFISYNAKDTTWGKKLQKKLEHYRMPAALCSEHGWKRTPISPVFFAPTDIQPGGLSEELQERLKASKNLIVICSPHSAKSKWVGKEIEFFHQLGRTKNIHFFIVDGLPHSADPDTECINPVIDQLGLPEILGANIHEKIYRWPWLNKERAYVQLISKLLDVEFDTVWQRHKRLLVKRIAGGFAAALTVVAVMIGIWKANQNFDAEIWLNEASVHNSNLPPLKDAIVTMNLENETKSDTIHSLDNHIIFSNIPHKYLNKEVIFKISCSTFMDTVLAVSMAPKMTLDIRRDEHYYGDVSFRLYHPGTETYPDGVVVGLNGLETVSDANGRVSFFVPLDRQQRYYLVTCPLPLENDTVFMPCGTNDVVLVK